MANTALNRRRTRRRRGKRELTELHWGYRDPRVDDDFEDEPRLGEDDGWEESWEDENEAWDDDWEEWGPPPDDWDEDDLA